MEGKSRLVVITTPLTEISEGFAKRYVSILSKSNSSILLISGIKDQDFFYRHVDEYIDISYDVNSKWERMYRYIFSQITTTRKIIRENASSYIFFLSQTQIMPVVTLKVFKKNVPIILFPGGSASLSYEKRDYRLSRCLSVLERIGYRLADKIILYSPSQMNDWGLNRYSEKIIFAGEHFIDTTEFKIIKNPSDRDIVVGFIGRLSQEKGIIEFIEAAVKLLSSNNEIRFKIAGSGDLELYVKDEISKEKKGKIELCGWIPQSKIPQLLNEIQLLVIPSYTEGLPNILLEAMACGTPVLATLVGAIPDIITDGKNGFIMENNSPECITENVLRALGSPNLDKIAKNERQYVEENYLLERAVARWREVLEKI